MAKRSSVATVLLWILLLSVPLGFYVRPSKASTIIVPDEYLTIQTAIAAASDGDIFDIVIAAGNYGESW
ncbi:MAG: hypothetical protein JSV35_07330 [Candidatus Bathyarchaeota archaeon]|nr:MAG: hypothetical protein JSV35_07330 [Candidatus Bathyarchaeota archaeon]